MLCVHLLVFARRVLGSSLLSPCLLLGRPFGILLRVGDGLDRSALVVPALDQLADLSGLDAILVELEALDELVGFPGVLHRRDRVGAAYLRLAGVLGVEEFVPKAFARRRL